MEAALLDRISKHDWKNGKLVQDLRMAVGVSVGNKENNRGKNGTRYALGLHTIHHALFFQPHRSEISKQTGAFLSKMVLSVIFKLYNPISSLQ
jgi:hypothetical protein